MPNTNHTDTAVVSAGKIKKANWHAWINKMPPPPDQLHVHGIVTVGNPGIDAFLFRAVPQGINPSVLILVLVLVQRPGLWPSVVVDKPAVYHEVGKNLKYTKVEIRSTGQPAFTIPVDIIV